MPPPRPPGPTRRLLAAAATVALWATAVLVLGSGPAEAQAGGASITVGTPAGSLYQPGRTVPVVVTVSAERLVRGEVVVRIADGPPTTVRQAVEVTGGATERVVLMIDVPAWSSGPTVALVEDGRTIARGQGIRPVHDEEPVGVFPSLANRSLPQTVPLAVDGGQAQLVDLDPSLLVEGPEVLGVFSYLVATAADLDALDPAGHQAVLSWVESGGRLVLDDDLPAALAGRVEVVGDRGVLGRGEVQLAAGRVAIGDLGGLFRPAPVVQSVDLPWGGGFWVPTLPLLGADAGMRAPQVTGLLVVVGAYIVGVGPLLWWLLRRRGREVLVWLAVPVVATVATALVWVTGLQLRAEASAAHATILDGDDHGTRASTDVLIATPHGGRSGITLPAGWRAAPIHQEEMGMVPGIPEPILAGDDLTARSEPGGFGAFRAVGRLDQPGGWRITAEASGDGVAGTVTNRSGHDLVDVRIYAGAARTALGSVPAGATVPFELGRGAASMPMEPVGMDVADGTGADGRGGAASVGAFSRWLTEQGQSATAPGSVTVIGWTRDLPAPLPRTSGEPVTTGRTGFVGRQPVSSGAAVAAAAVRSEIVRGASATRIDRQGRNGFVDFGLTMAHQLPLGAEATGLVLVVPPQVQALEVWSGDRWVAPELPPGPQLQFALPPTAVVGGAVYTRFGLGGDFWGQAGAPHPLVRTAEADEAFPPLEPVAGDEQAASMVGGPRG